MDGGDAGSSRHGDMITYQIRSITNDLNPLPPWAYRHPNAKPMTSTRTKSCTKFQPGNQPYLWGLNRLPQRNVHQLSWDWLGYRWTRKDSNRDTGLKANGVILHWDIRLKVSGHAGRKDETPTYFEGYRPAQMLDEVVSKVTFHQDLELGHLKENRWNEGDKG